ncbi:MAG TPA: PLP-dependent aminotransferase family protein [Anaerolineaceae bacterium]|jgi:2-aminoadipate transaminase|nr:PLP-dependent aminotransferase family protein [Longilinea sp.]HNS63438.1 PLP-dependent aminotransferase family protein [Anaerolineaceae bacterium]HNZ02052.1 PLP-dependent aminotransferase family protein [Anaerolineaceae bacterium]HOD44563.1 PLP-dependent aminotransferase family protein [Anaerolineaceae bacterium]HOH21210.1 PLP-dependent aminotransferase family protein [Anaerolineaceae bacterium]
MQTQWDHRYAQRTQRMKASAIRELLKLTENPEVISFAGGLPAPDVFPIDKFREACNTVLSEQGALALQYGSTEGYKPLREMIARHTNTMGVGIAAENVQITSGSQQALDLLGKILINRGDRILVEAPTYLGALQAWNAYGAEYVTVESDDDGMRTDALEEALRTGPKFIYVLPNFQNPTGVTMSLERRLQLVDLADRYGVPIIEDDPYGQLRFEGEHLPSVMKIDNDRRTQNGVYSGNVIYLSTFSKILAPGIRLAWVIAPSEVIRKLVLAKQGADLNTSTFNQLLAYEVGRGGFIDKHVQFIIDVYRERRDAMLEAMEEHMPAGVRWTHPHGGLFLWLTMPEHLKSTEVLQVAVEQEKVACVPGDAFYPDNGGWNTMRLNFSYSKPTLINEGISRLGRVIKRLL